MGDFNCMKLSIQDAINIRQNQVGTFGSWSNADNQQHAVGGPA